MISQDPLYILRQFFEIRVRCYGSKCNFVYAYLHSIRMHFLSLGLEEDQYTWFVLFRFCHFRLFGLVWITILTSLRLYEFWKPAFQKVDVSHGPIRAQIEKRKRTNHVYWPFVWYACSILRPRGPSGEWTNLHIDPGAGWSDFDVPRVQLHGGFAILTAVDSIVTLSWLTNVIKIL